MTVWSWLVLWVPPTLFLHILIHEGAHAAALKAFGAAGIRVRPYPLQEGGGFFWGRTTWTSWKTWTKARLVVAFAAPVLAELLWAVLALTMSLLWRWSAVEAGAALVDVGVWCLGLITRRDGTDAKAVLDALN
jgi:hypothetical protein